jgi:small subunit ribosomal protein S1
VAAQKYPPGTLVNAVVRGVTNYGAFVEVEEGIDGMIHISDLSWTRKFSHPNEALQKGDKVKCVVLDIDPEKQRVSLGIKQLSEDPWLHAIPDKYIPGHIVKGKVTKLTNFGAFVQLESDLEGLLHISELSDQKIKRPQDVVKVDDELEVKILKVDNEARKIGLSLRRVQWAAEEHTAPSAPPKKAARWGEPQAAPAPSSSGVSAGGDTLRVKEALARRAQAKREKAAKESQPAEGDVTEQAPADQAEPPQAEPPQAEPQGEQPPAQ